METYQIVGAIALGVICACYGAVLAGRICGFNGDIAQEGGDKSAEAN